MTAQVITTNINLEDNARVIKSIEAKIAELKELRDEKVAEVKDIMNQANVMELQAGAFTFKLTEITRNNIDTKTLKTKYAELYKAMAVLGCIFAVGVIATFIYSRMMVFIGQGVLKRIRDDMFEHMQTLPIRYFDQNTNGSVMSLYTNDTDTLRQMISQAIPQALMSLFTLSLIHI